MTHGLPLFQNGTGREVLKKRCREARLPIGALEALVEAELKQVGKLRKRGLYDDFEEILTPVADQRVKKED